MAELKTKVTSVSVIDFLNNIKDDKKREDSLTLLKLFTEVTGTKPKMWGASIIGFGEYHYKSERSTQEGDWPLTGFSPRAQALTLYLMDGVSSHESLLKDLGKFKKSSGSCLYIKKLEDVNITVLKKLLKESFTQVKKRYS